jgi:hypothetical protein
MAHFLKICFRAFANCQAADVTNDFAFDKNQQLLIFIKFGVELISRSLKFLTG